MNQTERHMKLLATILSTIFHPLLMPTYGIAIALYTSYRHRRIAHHLHTSVLRHIYPLQNRSYQRFQTSQPYRAYRPVYHQLRLLYRMLSLLIPFRDTELDTLFHSGCNRLAYHFFIYQPILENKRTHGSGRSDGCIGIPNEHL